MFTLTIQEKGKPTRTATGYIYKKMGDFHLLDNVTYPADMVKGVEWDGSLYTLYVQNIPNMPYQTEAKYFEFKNGIYTINGESFPQEKVIGIVKTKTKERT